MVRNGRKHRSGGFGGRYGRILGTVAITALIAGCSSTPDWANPMEWYRGASDAIFGEGEAESGSAEKSAEPQKTPGSDKPFPNLASVPERPKTDTSAERAAMARSLAADRANARYTDEEIKRQSADGAAPSPPTPTPAPTRSVPPSPAPVSASAPAVPPAPERIAAAAPPAPVPSAPPPPAHEQMSRALPPLPPSPAAPAAIEQRLGPNPVSQPPRFAAPPLSPAPVEQLRPNRRPAGNAVSVARVGNPTFGTPPADIASALNGGGGGNGFGGGSFAGDSSARIPGPSALAGVSSSVAGDRAAIITFKGGSADLDAGDRSRLRSVAQLYRQRGGAVRVEGHASSRTRDMDPMRHQMVNFDVSLSRANTVARELIHNGVPADAVFVAAMSDSQPIYYEVMPAGDAGNQRVEVYFVN